MIPILSVFFQLLSSLSSDSSNRLSIKLPSKCVLISLCLTFQMNNGFSHRAINLGASHVKTKYFFVMNPDTKIYKNTIKNLLIEAKKLKYFGALSPDQIKNKKVNLYKKKIIEQKQLDGGAILFQTNLFKHIKGFDKNIFLYYEENDYFHKCNNLNLKLL